MDIAELMELDKEEAEELSEEDYDKWKKLNDLKEEADENKSKVQEENEKAVDLLVEAGEKEVTDKITINDVELQIKFTMDNKQRKLFKSCKQYENMDFDENEEDLDKLTDKMIDLLNEIVVNYDRDAWEQFVNRNGLNGLKKFSEKIFLEIFERQQKEEEVIKKFR